MAFSNYPQTAVNAAKRALKHRKEYGSKCGTAVGWRSASIISQKQALTEDRLKRVFSFLSRARVYNTGKFIEDGKEVCGSVMYAAWGGTTMLNWARKELKKLEKMEEENKERARVGMIDGVAVYTTKEEASAAAEKLGCSGTHSMQTDDGKTVYMPCANHEDATKGYRSAEGVVLKRGYNYDVELRQEEEGNTIVGYAAVFNTITQIGTFREQIAPDAFNRVLTEAPDVVALLNHDKNYTLGRTTSDTLKLSVDEKGLRYELKLGNQSYAKDLYESMKRGDISQSSFAFTIERESWEEDLRTVEEVKGLYDVSIVTTPAYKEASASLRNAEACSCKKEETKNTTVIEKKSVSEVRATKRSKIQNNKFLMKKSDQLKSLRSNKLTELNALVEVAETEARDYTEAEVTRQEQLNADIAELDKSIERAETTEANVARFANTNATAKAEDVEVNTMNKRYNLQKALQEAAQGRLSGVEAEMHQEALREASQFGVQLRGNVCLPQSFVEKRNVYGVDSSQGGVNDAVTSVGTEAAPVAAALRANPVIQRLGATQLTGFVGDVKLPTLPDDKASLPAEAANATAFQNAMSSVTLSPQRFAAEITITKEALNQSTGNMSDVIARDFSIAIGNAIDRYAFAKICNGSVEGTQLALVPTDTEFAGGQGTLVKASESGTNDLAATDIADVMNLWADITGNGINDGAKFCMTPAVAGALMQLGSTGTGGNAALVGNNLMGYEALWTANIPTITGTNIHADAVLTGGAADVDLGSGFVSDVMFYGDWSMLNWCQWGGYSLTIDPFSGASAGTVKIVADNYFDVGLRHAGAIGYMLASNAVVAGADS